MAPSLSSCQEDMAFFTSILQHQHSPLRAPQNISVVQMDTTRIRRVQSNEDVTVYVGSEQRAYVLSTRSLSGSAYFHSLVTSDQPLPPIVLDCEPSVFENVLTILRYGSFSALPPMPASHMFKLKRELELLRIPLPSDSSSSPHPSSCSSSSSSSVSSVSSGTSSVNTLSSPSPRSMNRMPSALVELPGFLRNPEKLVVVSRSDGDRRWQCPSCEEDRNEWVVSFRHRHAFCAACGQPAIPAIPPKFIAEMFMAAASYYSGKPANPKLWSIRSDSACTLTFLSSSSSSSSTTTSKCQCRSSHDQVWAVSTYFSHAFCAKCGDCADAKTLLKLLFECRYGSRRKIRSTTSSNSLDTKTENNSSIVSMQ